MRRPPLFPLPAPAKKPHAVLYARVSTKEQEQGYWIPRRRRCSRTPRGREQSRWSSGSSRRKPPGAKTIEPDLAVAPALMAGGGSENDRRSVWWAIRNVHRTLCLTPTPEIRALFEGLGSFPRPIEATGIPA
jgi:hypothetical protein